MRGSAADKAYDVTAFVDDLRSRKVTPHMAVRDHLTKTGKQRKSKIGGQAKTKFRGQRRVEASFTPGLAACNLIRLPRLLAEAPT